MMRVRHDRATRRVACLAVASMLIPPVTPALQAQTPAPPAKTVPQTPATSPATPAKGAAPVQPGAPAAPGTPTTATPTTTAVRPPVPTPAAAPPPDGGWPRAYSTPTGGQIIVYQPQVADWDKQKHMTAYAAVSWQAKGAEKPSLGTIKLEADTKVATNERLVNFSDFKIDEANFPKVDRDQVREVVAQIDKAIPHSDRVIGLDRVLASVDTSTIIPREVPGVKADPPAIFYSTTPAVVVNLDGEAIWSPIKDNDLKFAVNTNWDLFEHGPTKTLYLRNNDNWLTAKAVTGPWSAAGTLPESFKKLPADENWKDVKAAVPGKPVPGGKPPAVFVSQTPAELILLRGAPNYVQVANTKLLWISNTESDVFRMGQTGPVYFLVAGRWFSAPDFKGPWTFATPSLPPDFGKIPLEHPRSRVLASIPGTQQAAEAVLLAQVPQTARVNKKDLKAPEVEYQGEPKFDAIPSTSVARAANTDKDIIKVGDLYYMCFQGVWFVSKSPTGPWNVTSSVPKEIYEIPASSPAHSVTYVTVEADDNDNDEWVTFAAVAGYTGVMMAWGCAVWGTGYYYPPYYGFYGGYPYYYPFYPTYGYGAYYNPWTGAYGRSAVAYGPYGGAGVTARYNPRTGTYSRGAAAWGPYGARGVAEAYNPRTGAYGRTRQGSGVYGSWGSTAVQRGDDWARTSRVTNRYTGNTTRVTQGSGGGEAISRRGGAGGNTTIGRTGGGDVYAGHDGNVYRKQGDGWQKWDNGSWGDTNRPEPTQAQRDAAQQRATDARNRAGSSGTTTSQLNRDAAARTQGTQRTRDYGTYQSSGGSRGAGSTYRPSGGGYRGGGGFRGGGGGRRR